MINYKPFLLWLAGVNGSSSKIVAAHVFNHFSWQFVFPGCLYSKFPNPRKAINHPGLTIPCDEAYNPFSFGLTNQNC
jgi:hypothetical protein